MTGHHLSAAGSFTLTGPTTLWTVNVNTGAPSATLTIYNNTSATGDVKAVIDASTKSSHAYGIFSHIGLHVVLAGGNADVTIGYE